MRASSIVVLMLSTLAVPAPVRAQSPAPSEADVRAAAARAVALLQRSVAVWNSRQSCFSCHHQRLAIATLRTALERGVPIDEPAAHTSTERALRPLASLDLAVQAVQQIDPAMSTGSWLLAAHDAGAPPALPLAVYARTLANRQEADGHWLTIDQRPPQSYSPVTATAVGLRAMQLYAPEALRDEVTTRVERARGWLDAAPVRDTEDRTSQIVGLAWAGRTAAELSPLVDRLLAEQRPDGGWGQIPRMSSDAYATGEVLLALHRAGGVPIDHPGWRKGLRFLLQAQHADGSWLVRTRVHEHDLVSPPYFETGFPHGLDQITSSMGTALAAMALMQALPAVAQPATLVNSKTNDAIEPSWMRAALFGSVRDLQSLLDRGFDPNSRTQAGTTVLMMAAHDPAKVRLLLARGADPKAVSSARHTALMVAANSRGSIESMRLLLDAGASPLPPVVSTRTSQAAQGTSAKQPSPVLYALWSGEIPKLQLLLDRGATLPKRLPIAAGLVFATPLELSVFQHDVPMVRFLVSKGLDVNGLGESGITPLIGAVIANDVPMVRALLALGAAVDQADQQGETALMHAAMIDFGDTAVVETLLKAGASRTTRSPDKLTASDLAAKFGHTAIVRVLD